MAKEGKRGHDNPDVVHTLPTQRLAAKPADQRLTQPSGAEGAASREAGLVFSVTQTAEYRTYSQDHLFFILIKPHSGGINAKKLFVLHLCRT